LRIGILFGLLLLACSVPAAELRVAVTANFAATLRTLVAVYPEPVQFHLSLGSSGALANQIRQGAPFDVFFSADAERPTALVASGHAWADSQRTYAYGVLALWSPRLLPAGPEQLSHPSVRFVAIPNAQLAPYGVAAEAVLAELGLLNTLRLVRGQSVGQSFQQVATGAADLGFVALSQLRTAQVPAAQFWLPEAAPRMTQQAVVLQRTAHPDAAHAFLAWLTTSPEAQQILLAAGYALPEATDEL